MKGLIREIVLSRAYQLASAHDEKSFLADPENALGWRVSPRRLDAECIRDAMLAVSGGLQFAPPIGSAIALSGDGSIGGFPIRSLRAPMNDEPFLNASGDVRSVYLPVPRDAVPDALAVFDFAEPNMVNGRREVTTVPAQALYLLNSEFAGTQSKRFAEKVLTRAGHDERVERAFQLAFSRPPTATERQSARDFFTVFPGDAAGEQAAWTSFCRALFASAEFRILN